MGSSNEARLPRPPLCLCPEAFPLPLSGPCLDGFGRMDPGVSDLEACSPWERLLPPGVPTLYWVHPNTSVLRGTAPH